MVNSYLGLNSEPINFVLSEIETIFLSDSGLFNASKTFGAKVQSRNESRNRIILYEETAFGVPITRE